MDATTPASLQPLTAADPTMLGDYQLEGRLGSGGMGIAYLATKDSTRVVVKTLHPHLAEHEEFVRRLRRELQTVRSISSDRTASVFDDDLSATPPWFAMEFVPGGTLDRRVTESGHLNSKAVSSFGLDLARALNVLHGAGIVHSDIKPANIMMSPTGPRLIDFGISQVISGDDRTESMTSTAMGSLGWSAPEQVSGDLVSPKTDVHAWALCVIFAHTGAAIFGGTNHAAVLYRVLHEAPSVPPGLPPDLSYLVTRALSKRPEERPDTDQIVALLLGEFEIPHASATPTTTAPTSAGTHLSTGILAGLSIAALVLGAAVGLLAAALT